MTEQIWINNIELDVNPTDIQIVTNRYSDAFNLTRENTPYAYVSSHGYTAVSIVLAFDLTNNDSIEQLINVHTQMDQFPFVWIKSHRLAGNISGFSQSIDGYSIYLVNTLTLKHTVGAQGVVFLNAELYYFNHTPLCHSWSFIDISKKVTRSTKLLSGVQQKSDTEYEYVSGLLPHESALFTSYFSKEIKRRKDLSFASIKREPNKLMFGSPQWYGANEKDDLIKDLGVNASITKEFVMADSQIDIYELARYNTTNDNYSGNIDQTSTLDNSTSAKQITTAELLSKQTKRETIKGYIAYINSTELSLEGLAVQDITLTKSNKIAVNKMAGYSEPMLQYMGKAPAQLTIEMIANSDGLYTGNEPITAKLSSASLINALIAKLESDTLLNYKLAPFKNFKIRNPLIAMSGCKYFAFDKKMYEASSETQGQETIILSFVESDLNSLGLKLQAKKVTPKPLFTDMTVMLKFISEITDKFLASAKSKTVEKVLEIKVDPVSKQKVGIPLVDKSLVQRIDSEKHAKMYGENAVYLILKNLNAALQSTIEIARDPYTAVGTRIYDEKFPINNDTDLNFLSGILLTLKSKGIADVFKSSLIDPNHEEFEVAARAELLSNAQFAIEQAFYMLVYVATNQRDPILGSSFITFAENLVKNSNKDIEQIGGEAIPDFNFSEHIDTSLFPNVNPQNISPFFFLEQNIYLDPDLIKQAYDLASPSIDKAVEGDNTREVLKLDEYYREGLPQFVKLKSELAPVAKQNDAIALSKRVQQSQNVLDNIDIIKAEAQAGGIPAWLILTMAEIESSLGQNMVNKNNPHSDFWGIMQVGHLVRDKYGIKGQSRYYWESNVAANVRTCIRWYNDELRRALKRVASQNAIGYVSPAWLYLLHQQGGPFINTLNTYKKNGYINNTSYKSTLLAQGAASTAEETINFFFNKFYTIAKRYVPANQMYQEFYTWLGINTSAGIPLKSTKSLEVARADAQLAKNAVAKPTNNISLETSSPTIQINGGEYQQVSEDYAQLIRSAPIENKPSKSFKGMNTSTIDIYNDSDQAQYRALRTGKYFEYGMNLAVPTARVYIVEGNENNILDRLYYRKRNLFEVYGLADLQIITANEDEPASAAVFSILNPASAYTDFDSIASHRLKIDPSKLETRDELILRSKTLRLVVGTQIHIRIGYSNNPNDLETVFNGEITEVDGEAMLTIVAQGYGRELIMREHAPDKPHGVGGTLNASTSSIIHEVMRFDEVQHFGSRDPLLNSKNPYARNILSGVSTKEIKNLNVDRAANGAIAGLTGFTTGTLAAGAKWGAPVGVVSGVIGASSTPKVTKASVDGEEITSNGFLGDNILPAFVLTASELFTNTYSPPVELVDPYYTADNKSIFTAPFKLNEAFHVYFPIYQSTPWEILSEMEYRHPNTRSQVLNYEQRCTYFFGIKEQLYYADSPYIQLINSVGQKVEAVFNNAQLAESERFRDLKPVADFHLFTTEHNIIQNDLKISTGFGTQANIRYFENNPSKEDFKEEDFEWITMQADDNLLPDTIRTFDIAKLGIDHKGSAFRYGQVGLRKEAEKMYSGKIVVIGNPFIKAGDFAYLNDTQRELRGIIKVKECVHLFSAENGYTTEIVPALYVEEAMQTYSYLFSKLGLAYSMLSEKLRQKIHNSYMTANEYTPNMIRIIEKTLIDATSLNQLKSTFDPDNSKLSGIETTIVGLSNFSFYTWTLAVVRTGVAGFLSPTVVPEAGKFSTFLQGSAKLIRNVGTFASAGAKSSFEALKTITARNALQRGIGMQVARSALSLAGASTAIVGSIVTSPVFVPGVIIGIAMMYTVAKIQEIEATRQPLRLFPLLHNGAPYIAGMTGWQDNTYLESSFLEMRKTWAATGKIYNYGTDIIGAKSTSDYDILNTRLIEARTNKLATKYGIKE